MAGIHARKCDVPEVWTGRPQSLSSESARPHEPGSRDRPSRPSRDRSACTREDGATSWDEARRHQPRMSI